MTSSEAVREGLASVEGNKAIVRRLYDEFYNGGDLSAADRLMAADVFDHNPQPEQGAGLEGVKQAFARTQAILQGARATVEDMVAEGDRVVARWTVRDSNEALVVAGTSIFRIAGGEIEEMWHHFDPRSFDR